jgi:hypothetical protein
LKKPYNKYIYLLYYMLKGTDISEKRLERL